jgi:CelD/BcsL family acetyltransferase involved in cellulose biosynthesis
LRVQLFKIDDRIHGFWFGFVYGGVFHSSETGYDPEMRDLEVGTLMFLKLADSLIADGVRRVDFGIGDADYKKRFGDRSWRETSAWLFAPTAKGLSLVALLAVTSSIDRAARSLAARSGLTARLKRHWRGRLTQKPAPSGDVSPAPQ